MEYQLTQTLNPLNHDCIVIGYSDDKQIQELLNPCEDKALQALVTHHYKKLTDRGDWLWNTELKHAAVLFYYCGPLAESTPESLQQQLTEITTLLLKQKIKSAQITMPHLNNLTPDTQLRQMLLTVDAQCYLFNDFKTIKKKSVSLRKVHFHVHNASKKALHLAEATAQGIRLTRWLSDLPANYCTPSFLADEATKLADEHANIQVITFGHETMKELGMGALLAVAQGSSQPPRFIEVNYQGHGKSAPIVLIGKGITFDSGGISLKPPAMMEEMKYDMAGAASVLGTIKACALLKLPLNIVGLIPTTENLPSGSAIKPGDVIKSLSGQTIEIVNTDAEGRLILADALTYAERFNPKLVLDMATLTGAVIIALGHIATGFMTQDEELAAWINKAAAETNDKAWRLPLEDAYQEGLESPVADMLNSTADRSAGSVTAACFLSRFAKKMRWAHLDIAGTAWVSGKNRQATGRPVPLLVEFLQSLASR